MANEAMLEALHPHLGKKKTRLYLIEAEEVEAHPEGVVILAVRNGFGCPHVQFHQDRLQEIDTRCQRGDVVTVDPPFELPGRLG